MNTTDELERTLRITTRIAATLALVISGYFAVQGSSPSGDISNLHMAAFYIFVLGSAGLLVYGVPGTRHTPTALWATWFIYAGFIYYVNEGAVFHSDRGSVYTSAAYAELAEEYKVKLSVGRTGVLG